MGGPRSIVSPSARTIDEIDVEYHFRHTARLASGGERELGEQVSHLHSVVLDRTRPPDSGANGVIITQGGSVGGWSLYAHEGS